MASVSRPTSVKLLFLCALYCCMSDENRPSSSSISSFAHALLYHKYQPTPLLSRANRQPHTQQQPSPEYSAQNGTSDSYYNNYDVQASPIAQQNGGYNRPQQLQPRARPAEPQIAYLRDSYEEDDTYGCPAECHCNKIAQIADCTNRNLTRVPSSFPKNIKRIQLDWNNISEIGPYAFQGLRRLQRIDLSNNNINKIDALALSGGLPALIKLILFRNKIEYLPVNVFNELSQLQILLLNANTLQTIHKDLFQSLTNLNLLSLHDNNIATLANGTFDGLKSIKKIHLGNNPLNCDCNLRWLVDILMANPTLETSEASCKQPWREQGKRLIHLNTTEMKCQEQPVKTSQAPVQAFVAQEPTAGAADPACPQGCVCNGVTIDCSHSPLGQESRTGGGGASGGLYELPDVPDDLPVYVTRVHINDQRIKRIRQTSLFRKLANSQKLDLGNNKIVDVEDNAINGQLPNGQKPDRVIFVLLENQQCDAQRAISSSRFDGEQAGTVNSVVGQFRSSQPTQNGRVGGPARQQVDIYEDPCAAAPKVNEPQFDSPCYNGGACKTAQGANFSCECPAGFGGPLCELNLDDCLDHQCQNGAMCVDGIDSYKCICRDPTTSGEFCEQLNNNANTNNNNNNNNLFNPPYATNSANSIAPLALPMMAQQSSSVATAISRQLASEQLAHSLQQPKQPQILARSADFLRAPDDLAMNSLQVGPGAGSKPTGGSGGANGGLGSPSELCHRITTSRYFDDGNGCQSVRLLKMSECAGGCNDASTGASCCAPTKIKRRRIHMQCSDGASYVKVIDLIKKCSCSQDVASCAANNELPFGDGHATTVAPVRTSAAPSQYFKYSTGGAGGDVSAEYIQTRRDQPMALSRHSVRGLSYNTSSSMDQDSLLRLDAVE